MTELDFRIVEKRRNFDGRELWLVERSDGSTTLFMPRQGGKDKVRLEVIQKLRTIISSTGDLITDGLVKLQGIRIYDESILLDLGYQKGLWANWETGMPNRISPSQAANLLRKMVAFIEKMQKAGVNSLIIHPTDAANLGDEGIAVLDPRIGEAFDNVDPVRPNRELCLPPEVIAGQSWTTQGMLYTAGLTVYTLACGIFPFKMENLSESASAVLREVPLDMRCYAPEVSERLAFLIQRLLEKKPEGRPDIEEVNRTLTKVVEDGFTSSPEEQEAFRIKTEAMKAQREKVRKVRRIWQVGRWVAVGALAVAVILFLARPGYKAKITKETPPQKVVDQFYTAYARLDVMSLDETLYKTGKDIDRMVGNAFVLSSYNPEQKARKVLVLNNLQIKLTSGNSTERCYTAGYRLVLYNSGGRNLQQRSDRLTLRPVRGIWRIVDFQSKIVSNQFIKDLKAPSRLDKIMRKR